MPCELRRVGSVASASKPTPAQGLKSYRSVNSLPSAKTDHHYSALFAGFFDSIGHELTARPSHATSAITSRADEMSSFAEVRVGPSADIATLACGFRVNRNSRGSLGQHLLRLQARDVQSLAADSDSRFGRAPARSCAKRDTPARMRGHRWAGLLSLPHGIVWQTYVPGVSERRSLSDGDASLQHVCGAT